MNKRDLSAYMSKIGKIGGKKSRRVLTTEQARAMQELSVESKLSRKHSERIAIARKAGSAPKRKKQKKGN